jgi:hypothetical protein
VQAFWIACPLQHSCCLQSFGWPWKPMSIFWSALGGGASATGGRCAVKSDVSCSGFLPLGTALRTIRLVEQLKGSDRIWAWHRIRFALFCWGCGLLLDVSVIATYKYKCISTPICSKIDTHHHWCNSFSPSSRHCTNIRPDPCKSLRLSSGNRYRAVKPTIEVCIDESDIWLTVGWIVCSIFLQLSSSACRLVSAFETP